MLLGKWVPVNMQSRPFVQLDEVARECFNHTVSLFWGEPDGNCSLRSATGFLIELDAPFLFTARHVIEEFLKAQLNDDSLELKVGKGNIDHVSQRIVARNDEVDLVALNLSEIDDLSEIDVNSFQLNHIKFFKPKRWPPKGVSLGAQVFFIGFVVDAYREILHLQRAILFNSFTVGTQVDSALPNDFSCRIKMENVQRNTSPEARWPVEYGGLSGSPVFVIWDDIGLELVGIVFEATNSLNIIRAHHIHFINSDGTL